MIPRAFDSAGTKLAVSSSYQIDEEGIHLRWEGNDMESHHSLVLWAIDSHNQEVVCEIKVTLQGRIIYLPILVHHNLYYDTIAGVQSENCMD